MKNFSGYKISIRTAFTRCLLEMRAVIFWPTFCLVFSRQSDLSWRHFSSTSNLGRGQWVALVQWEAAASTPAINHATDRYLTTDDGCPCIVNGALISVPPSPLVGGSLYSAVRIEYNGWLFQTLGVSSDVLLTACLRQSS